MKTYDLIIIGGGISGLYLAYKLYSNYKDILLLEVSSELGGRIKTDTLHKPVPSVKSPGIIKGAIEPPLSITNFAKLSIIFYL